MTAKKKNGRSHQKKPSLLDRLAANMRMLRAKLKLSQKEVAEKAGVSVSYISMLERGQRSPPLETIEKVGKVFRMDGADLLK